MSSSAFWLLALLVVSVLGTRLALRGERRRPSSYSRRPDVLARWRAQSTEAQAAHDNAVLDAAEAAENVVARVHSLYRP
ncbi:hypothetical protein [Streptomyces sp. NBRC 110035]|uniref:hypothetical protein n=1 Tax=Streptomyces sp. NBRC 110035 TaxID=1547867 RepID=UPI00131AA5D7|nr:hypothetical protein [Streptomyces sp. NBRC 110035]